MAPSGPASPWAKADTGDQRFLLYPSGGPSGQIYLSMTSIKQNSACMVNGGGPFSLGLKQLHGTKCILAKVP